MSNFSVSLRIDTQLESLQRIISIFCFKLKDIQGTGSTIVKKNMYNSDCEPIETE